MAKTKAKKAISQAQYEAAVKRYAENTAKSQTIIDKSEEKIKAEMAARHTKLGNMPAEIAEDEATIMQYAEDNRQKLFGDAKTHNTGLGVVISYRTGNPKMSYNEGVKADDLVQHLLKKQMVDYLKVTHTLDAKMVIGAAETDKKLAKALETVGAAVVQEEIISVKYEKS